MDVDNVDLVMLNLWVFGCILVGPRGECLIFIFKVRNFISVHIMLLNGFELIS